MAGIYVLITIILLLLATYIFMKVSQLVRKPRRRYAVQCLIFIGELCIMMLMNLLYCDIFNLFEERSVYHVYIEVLFAEVGVAIAMSLK